MRNSIQLTCGVLLASGWLAASPAAITAEARPDADEECVMQCDEESDRCMSEAGNDEDKAKACDDRYSKCLEKCR